MSLKEKLPSFNQWKRLFKILNKKEKIYFSLFFILFLFSFLFLSFNFYFNNTQIVPKQGGIYTEGLIGQPRFINPVYATSNDVDRDLTEILFSGLMKYDSNGNLVLDLAKGYNPENEGRGYTFYLKENVFWSDNEKLTADDIIFTIETIQNPDYKSELRTNWLGVDTEKISEYAVKFILDKPYSGFLERLTLKILPAHIWKEVSADNFSKSYYNLQPVTCGPYKIDKVDQDKKTGLINSLTLERDENYFNQKPYISKIIFYFFETEEDLVEATQQGRIKGLSLNNFQSQEIPSFLKEYALTLPRYFAIFFNPEESDILEKKEIRQALNYGTNKQELIDKVLADKATIVDSPILPEIFNFQAPETVYEYDAEKAKKILEDQGFKETENGYREKEIKKELAFSFKSELSYGSENKEVEELQRCLVNSEIVGEDIYPEKEITGYFGNKTKEAVIRFQEKYREEILDPGGYTKGTGTVGQSTRKKLNQICFDNTQETLPLKFSLVTVDDPVLKEIADLIKEQWQKIGVELEINVFSVSDLQYDCIKPRNYESLLFGEVLGIIPDPYPFWHSLQKVDPGLNLAIYENKKTDKLLEGARQLQDMETIQEKLEEFQNLLIADAPCVFLYSPNYTHLVSKEIRGINPGLIADPSKRFSQIEDWYIKTKRTFK